MFGDKLMKRPVILRNVVIVCILLTCGVAGANLTSNIAYFNDPSGLASDPFFTIDVGNGLVTGGWDDSRDGLDLYIPYSGAVYYDAYFTMTDLAYVGNLNGGFTSGGVIDFFDNGGVVPVLTFTFGSASVSPVSLGGVDLIFSDNVTISGSEIEIVLTDESFTFGFANQTLFPDGSGYTSTSNFISSATVPEPATVGILGLGLAAVGSRRKR